MSIFKRLIIHWFNLEPEICESCETLKSQLEICNFEKKQMLQTILDFTKPVTVEHVPTVKEVEPIRPKAVPWRIRQQELERNDRITAENLKKIKEENEKLEEELGLKEEANA